MTHPSTIIITSSSASGWAVQTGWDLLDPQSQQELEWSSRMVARAVILGLWESSICSLTPAEVFNRRCRQNFQGYKWNVLSSESKQLHSQEPAYQSWSRGHLLTQEPFGYCEYNEICLTARARLWKWEKEGETTPLEGQTFKEMNISNRNCSNQGTWLRWLQW